MQVLGASVRCHELRMRRPQLTRHRLNAFLLLATSVCAVTEAQAEPVAATPPATATQPPAATPPAAATQPPAATAQPAAATQPPATKPPAAATPPPATKPPEGVSDGYDWIQLYSGEWLKGWMETMREGTLYFESEVLYSLYIDWVSVVTLYSSQYHTYVFRDGTSVVAKGVLENGQLRLAGRTFSPNRVSVISAGGMHELDHWHFKLRSGLSLHHSSSSQFTWTNSTELMRDDGIRRGALRYDGTLGQVDGARTVSSHTGSLQVDIMVTSALYLLPFYGSLNHDLEQNMALRTTLGTGAGVHIVDIDGASWEVSFGPAYVSSLPITSETGAAVRSQDAGIIMNTDAEFDLTKALNIGASWQSVLTVTGTERSYHQATAELELELGNIVTLNLGLIFDRVEDPETTESGETPARNSLQLHVGLGVKL
jgi:Protein of unknown function, DUF481